MTVSPGPSASRQGESSCKRILFMQKSILCSLMQKKYDRWQRRAVLHHSSTRRRGQWPFLMHCFVGLCLVLWPQKVWYSNLVVLWSFVLIFSCFVPFFMEVPKGFNFANSQFLSNHQLPQNDNQPPWSWAQCKCACLGTSSLLKFGGFWVIFGTDVTSDATEITSDATI